jgi:signal transduction histidine kinase
MAISYRIVQEHGGKIDVTTKEGLGTTIAVSLPLTAAATMPADVRRTDPVRATG